MEELLKALKEQYDRTDNTYVDEYDGETKFTEDELYHRIVGLCCEHLIADGGQCNWDNIEILRNNGYRVWAGEKDSFGWLIGCVRKLGDNRVVYYG